MQIPGPLRGIQWIIALSWLVCSLLNWHFNQVGSNFINLTACMIFLVGIDNLIIYYRCYIEQTALQNQGTFVVLCLFSLGNIFEEFNKTSYPNLYVNVISWYLIVTILILNGSYYLGIILILIGYLVRQIYRLMTETLLSANQNIQRAQMELLTNGKKLFSQLKVENPAINDKCSICLFEFEDDQFCIKLPGCGHCFHDQCIQEWLTNKSTCPYCRNNIRLNLI